MAETEDGNEHALKWVIGNVECLCEEYSKVTKKDDAKQLMHLQLSTGKILNELEMPTIEHAKTEVFLLTRLLDGLSRLTEHCERVLETSEVISRLKSFREEMQELFILSPVCSIKSTGARPKMEIAIAIDRTSRTSTVSAPERTKTPTEEALREGHEKDRSDRVSELDESALLKIGEQFSGKKSERSRAGSSTDSYATRTPNPSSSREDPDERSQRIWMEEDLEPSPPSRAEGRDVGESRTPPQLLAKRSKVSTDTDAIRTPTDRVGRKSSGSRADLMDVAEEPTILKLQRPPEPETMKLLRLPEMVDAEEVTQQESGSPRRIERKLIFAIAIIVLPVLLLWAIFFILDWRLRCLSNKPRDGPSGVCLVGWRIICCVANAFCENYGLCCTAYCASGFQRDKWQCSR